MMVVWHVWNRFDQYPISYQFSAAGVALLSGGGCLQYRFRRGRKIRIRWWGGAMLLCVAVRVRDNQEGEDIDKW